MICTQPTVLLLLMMSFMFAGRVQSFRNAPAWRPSAKSFVSSGIRLAMDKPTLKTDWVLRFDGGSRGNPGLGGSGAAIYNFKASGELNEVWRGYFYVGEKGITNNQAEYAGLLEGLAQSKKMNIQSLCVQGDSELVLKQVQGIYKVRHLTLIPLHRKALRLLASIPLKTFKHLPRAQNWRADELSNMAMDRKATMQAFSPEFAAFLEHHSETVSQAAAESVEVKREHTTTNSAHVGSGKTAEGTVEKAAEKTVEKTVEKTSEKSADKEAAASIKHRRGRPTAAVAASSSMEQTVDVLTIPIESIPTASVLAPLQEIVAPAKRRRSKRESEASAVPVAVQEEPKLPIAMPVVDVTAPAKAERKKRTPKSLSSGSAPDSVAIVAATVAAKPVVTSPLVSPIAEVPTPVKKKRTTKKSTLESAKAAEDAHIAPVLAAPVVPVAPAIPVVAAAEAVVPSTDASSPAKKKRAPKKVPQTRNVESAPVVPVALPVLSVECPVVDVAAPVKKKRASRAKKD